MTQFRQGDVLIRQTKKKPSAAAVRVADDGRVILAYGEVTGHAHAVEGVDNTDGNYILDSLERLT